MGNEITKRQEQQLRYMKSVLTGLADISDVFDNKPACENLAEMGIIRNQMSNMTLFYHQMLNEVYHDLHYEWKGSTAP